MDGETEAQKGERISLRSRRQYLLGLEPWSAITQSVILSTAQRISLEKEQVRENVSSICLSEWYHYLLHSYSFIKFSLLNTIWKWSYKLLLWSCPRAFLCCRRKSCCKFIALNLSWVFDASWHSYLLVIFFQCFSQNFPGLFKFLYHKQRCCPIPSVELKSSDVSLPSFLLLHLYYISPTPNLSPLFYFSEYVSLFPFKFIFFYSGSWSSSGTN